VDLSDGDGVEVVELLSADLLGRDEVRRFEHAEVLHHTEARQVGQARAQLAQALAVALEQRVEQRPPAAVGHRSKDEIHGRRYR